jgi:excisionase family DNA binding protein
MVEKTNAVQDDDVLLVSPIDAMRLLNVSSSMLYILTRSGEIDSLKIGSTRRFPLSSIKSFIARRLAANPANRPRRGRYPKVPADAVQIGTQVEASA